MRLFSFAVSLLLHGVLLGAVAFMASAAPAPLLDRLVYTVDLVTLGPLGTPEAESSDFAAQVPARPVAPDSPRIDPVPVPEPPRVEPVRVPEPPRPEPEPAVEPPTPAPPRPDPRPAQPRPRQPSAEDILRAALADAQRTSAAQRPSDDPIAGALEELRNPQASRGGPEGVGSGGTAGIEGVYIAQIIAAVRPNWKSVPQARRQDLRVVVRIDLSPSGDVLRSHIVSTSGDARMDSSALDAIAATGTLPPPPNAAMRSLDVTFRLSDMDSGRS
jgi:protein TonB